jgi:3-deoxy-manno-octulosonate cytidylyltransferase (CMP-KDO synthetase)
MHATKVLIVIPARLRSTRLPKKLLLAETGKPLLQHTYEAASRVRRADGVLVATEDAEIVAAVQGFGGDVCLTGSHATGTDRVAEAVRDRPGYEMVVNLQGDEPEIEPAAIDLVIELLQRDSDAVMATLAAPLRDSERFHDPSCVKVVFDARGRALYFSRSPIPYLRGAGLDLRSADPPLAYAHVGLYAYRRSFLQTLADLPQSPAEICESLEQLRVLHAGYGIQVGVVSAAFKGIDTWDDYRAFVSRQTT